MPDLFPAQQKSTIILGWQTTYIYLMLPGVLLYFQLSQKVQLFWVGRLLTYLMLPGDLFEGWPAFQSNTFQLVSPKATLCPDNQRQLSFMFLPILFVAPSHATPRKLLFP